MKRIFIILAITLFAILSGINVSVAQSCTVSGTTQRCDPVNGCPKVDVPLATVTLEIDENEDGEYEIGEGLPDTRLTTNSSSLAYYCFVAGTPSKPARVKAEKDSWSSGWISITMPPENREVNVDLIPDDFQCNCK